MPSASRPLRLLLIAVLALALGGLLWIVFGALRSGIALWHDVRDLPVFLQWLVALALAAAAIGVIAILWYFFGPRKPKPMPKAPPSRADIELRMIELREKHADTAALQNELEELDRRARSEELYVAVFGEISAGKSSLIRALAPQAEPEVDVTGGTTRAVTHFRNDAMTFADVPGSHEVSGAAREQLARDEALRAHVVLYVCAGDLTRDQDAELRWLHGFGKPTVLILNKADQFEARERDALLRALRERYGDVTDAQIVVSAGGLEKFERQLPDGRREHVERERLPDVVPLKKLLTGFAKLGAAGLESSREAAVLTSVAGKADMLANDARDRDAAGIIAKYTKRAVVGALAAVVPGSDLVIQGVIGAALIRELAKLYGVSVRDVDIDQFLSRIKLTVRTSTSIVLAIAGNALKAFPGLGTLGGGALHAIAYGLLVDSLGRAVAITLRDQHTLDSTAAGNAMAQLLSQAGAERMRAIARLALDREISD
jgi:GTP-binding protein EngB required for normal cell division